jgi:hypothetical protein
VQVINPLFSSIRLNPKRQDYITPYSSRQTTLKSRETLRKQRRSIQRLCRSNPSNNMSDIKGVTYLDSDWALNPIVRRDVSVHDLLSSIGGDAFPQRRKLLVDLLDIDESWHMHVVSDGHLSHITANNRRTS